MAKFCPNCGKEVADGEVFCGSCGANINGEAPAAAPQPTSTGGASPAVQERNIVLAIVLSIITCGIYGIYWFIVLTDDANAANGDTNDTSGIMAFVFSLITCGIYGLYWYYKMGKKMFDAGQKHGVAISDNSLIYILLGVFGFGIVNYCLIQNDLNKIAAK
jgi:hypothetical protein